MYYDLKLIEVLRDEFPTLTEFEALKIYSELQRNAIFANAFMVNVELGRSDNPSALEAIGITLGVQDGLFGRPKFVPISESIDRLAENMDKMAEAIKNFLDER